MKNSKEKRTGDNETIEVLSKLLGRGVLTKEEEEAVRSAIGVLAWTTFAERQIQNIGNKRRRILGGLTD